MAEEKHIEEDIKQNKTKKNRQGETREQYGKISGVAVGLLPVLK
jgi:hypothetical protein